MNDSDLGAALKSLRSLHSTSQEEIADLLGVHRTRVIRVESGERSISALEIAIVAKFFDISIDDFYKLAQLRVNRRLTVNCKQEAN